MNDTLPYRRWVGVVLAFLISGSAHFLSGRRAAGITWYLGLFAGSGLGIALLAIPGPVPYLLGVAVALAVLALWLIMLKQSLRPVPRIGVSGWLGVLMLTVALVSAQRLVIRQFVHAFYIPTGSMGPTLVGAGVEAGPVATSDRPGLLQWMISGRRYRKVTASCAGTVSSPRPVGPDFSQWTCKVGSEPHRVPPFAQLQKPPGTRVAAGETLWSGVVTSGDRILVDRFSYRFTDPQRGDIVVFRTTGIGSLRPGQYYVFRVVGLPGERIRIDPPHLIVNDNKVTEPPIFATIANQADGYPGYILDYHLDQISSQPGRLSQPADEVQLGDDAYFVLGDNSPNSADSRHWGPVPRKNILGKVTRIYWPLTRINALAGK